MGDTSPRDRLPLLGLLGGMGWESSALYYRTLNEEVRRDHGGLRSARCLLASVDFSELAPLVAAESWAALIEALVSEACALDRSGVDGLAICSNTSHIAATAVSAEIAAPLLHIADPIGAHAKRQGYGSVAVLGTRPVLEQDFLLRRWRDDFGLNLILPHQADRTWLHEAIYAELLEGRCSPETQQRLTDLLRGLVDRGAESVFLACTDLSPWLPARLGAVECLDTAALHAHALARWRPAPKARGGTSG